MKTSASWRRKLRAKYNLSLTDSLQIAVAIQSKFEAFLTNDLQLKGRNSSGDNDDIG
ncbi:hypothetical protein [Okeania sp. SIO2B3]|uniref:hypothetical protein n=1 Tax=Okeania sp. SIO2B3 TaxID=2607784 RepID=UPI0025D405F7|nr:hypothetical protein [Okeania sp. SIO2B3]